MLVSDFVAMLLAQKQDAMVRFNVEGTEYPTNLIPSIYLYNWFDGDHNPEIHSEMIISI